MPKRLTQEHKQEILELYRNTPATTSTLAERYQVSSSTISRFLQKTLPHDEYEELIQLKRLARTEKPHEKTSLGSVKPKPVLSQQNSEAITQTVTSTEKPTKSVELNVTEDENEEDGEDFDIIALGEMLGEDVEDNDGDWDEDWHNDNDAEILEDESEEFALTGDEARTILPLSKAMFPKVCYVVINRRAELIVRPLKECNHLGEIPKSELKQQTLPVFTNYRVARRFSNRFQRVMKIPNGSLLLKTSSHLLAKGINYLLMDNRLYSLVP